MSHAELIRDMLDNIHTDNNAEAQQNFTDLISMKLTDALDQRKMEIAQQLGARDASVQADS
jgi:hypothetical protein